MSQYEKPKMTILTLNGNEQLCGSCSEKGAHILLATNPESDFAKGLDWMIGNLDGKIDRLELINVFGSGEPCAKQVNGYCKFAGTISVAWS